MHAEAVDSMKIQLTCIVTMGNISNKKPSVNSILSLTTV